ncbi:MAG TPA: aminoglycoside phosphotransferase family protein [Roseiflexaceae bacterium]|nr:aminoglycoside phosphotransferase family protein [Roseiflexaceae bacterium]
MIIPDAIAAWLASQGFELDDDVLPALGLSGAAVVGVERAGVPAILKLVPGAAPEHVRERARRERLFYTQLAPHLPIQTPELLAWHENAAGFALVLAHYAPSGAAATWTAAQWHAAAQDIAAIHAAWWGTIENSPYAGWLKAAPATPSAAQIAQARAAWHGLRSQARLAALFKGANEVVEQALELCSASPLVSLPLTLCHGDCHTGNVLSSSTGAHVWSDWQDVGIGVGAADLSFFWQRATADGALIELEELLHAYCDALDARLPEPPARANVEQAMQRSELHTRALEWPFYLRDAAPEQVQAQLERLALLVKAGRQAIALHI